MSGALGIGNSEYKGRRIDIKNESEFEENLIRSWIDKQKNYQDGQKLNKKRSTYKTYTQCPAGHCALAKQLAPISKKHLTT